MKTTRLSLIFPIFLSASALFSPLAFAQQDYTKVQIKTEKLSATTYMMTGAGGNLGVSIGEDAVFVIDDQFAPLTPKIKAAIKKLTDKPIKFVLNTHWHFDHTGGNENMGKQGALIVSHENVRKRLSAEGFIKFFGMKTKAEPKAALPVVTFTRDMSFHINGDQIHAVHVPNAHTDGDSIVYFQTSDVIHMGDTYFNGLYPFIDTSSGGTVDGMIAASDQVLAIAGDNTKIIPGHGPISKKTELKAFRDMLVSVSTTIKAQIKDGKSMAEVVAAKPTAEFDAVWGKGFLPPQKWVEMLYENLKG